MDKESGTTSNEGESSKASDADKSIGDVVASHYNSIEETLKDRCVSRIFYLRNFNNWIKGQLIHSNLKHRNAYVLDICCGKGGDLLKWRASSVRHVVCVDIASVSVDQCRLRYTDMKKRYGPSLFTAEFYTVDCTKVRLLDQYENPKIRFDVTSCQFALHYSFESLPQAEVMLRNISENLKTGGIFIATIPNAAEIVRRFREAKSNRFGNDIYHIEMLCEEPFPLFGAKYDFSLDNVVNCPEFLVHLPTLIRLAKEFGLKFKSSQTFQHFYATHKLSGWELLNRFKGLQVYPSNSKKKDDEESKEFGHVGDLPEGGRVLTISLSQWEVISLYSVIEFTKV